MRRRSLATPKPLSTAPKRHTTPRLKRSRLSDPLFRLFVDSVKDCAIYTLDPRGRVTSWNQGAERLKGYSDSEIIGRDFSCFFTPEDRKKGKPAKSLAAAARTGRLEDECWLVRKDGSRFWASTILTAIKDSKGRLSGFAKVTRDATNRMRSQDQLQRANAGLAAELRKQQSGERQLAASEQSLRELSLQLLSAQDEERRRIGRELHDGVGQYLAMLKMHLESMDLSPKRTQGQITAQIAQCARLADDALKEVRTVSHLLHPPTLEDMGLRSAIPWFLDGFSRRSGIQTTFEVTADFPRLPKELEISLFRVLQECLNNVLRHSGSNKAIVRLFLHKGNVVLQVNDFGKGIPAEFLSDSGKVWMDLQGLGLRGMRERMRHLGGDLSISSNHFGTEVCASAPLETAEAASD
jgi:PAS domain S-box-containing protein